MRPKLITFDCAHTLVDVRWQVDRFIQTCADKIGLDLPAGAASRYLAMYIERYPAYCEVNLLRSPEAGQAFWDQISQDWFQEFGISHEWHSKLKQVGEEELYGEGATWFTLYPDTLDCLDWVRSKGIRTAIVSNWDYSLHRIVRMLGIYDRFEVVLASLEEGVEKPDPRLFQLCLDKMGVKASETVHVGDNPEDDFQGAINAGIRPVLLDRNRTLTGPTIRSLSELPEAIDWTD